MAKKIVKLDYGKFKTLISESVMKVLKEWQDFGDESYREGPDIFDCAYNLNVNSAKVEQDMEHSEWWLKKVYENAKMFIELYDKTFTKNNPGI